MSEKQWTQLRARVDTAQLSEGNFHGPAVPYDKQIHIYQGAVAVMKPGVFSRQTKDPARVKVLWQHDTGSPIGHATRLDETKAGLEIFGKISLDPAVTDAARALALLREGIIDEMSIGFEWQEWTESKEKDLYVYTHTRARLREVSIVTAGAAGRDARVKSVHSVGDVGSRLDYWRDIFGVGT